MKERCSIPAKTATNRYRCYEREVPVKIETNKKVKFLIDISFVIVIVGAVFLVLKYALPLLIPFVIGFCVALLINKLAARIAPKLRIPQGILSVILLVVLLCLVGLFMFLIGNQIREQTLQFISQKLESGDLSASLTGLLEKIASYVPLDMRDSLVTVIKEQAGKIASSLTASLAGLVMKAPSFLIALLISIIASFIIAGDYRKITSFILRQFPEKIKKLIPEVKSIMVNSVFKLFKAYSIIMLITFSELALGLTILGEKYALAIAAITAVVDILPVLGSGSILLPWFVISLFNANYTLAIGLLILYIIILVVRQIIEPKVVGHSIGLHPIITLMALYVGFQVFGVVGMFGLPVLLIIIKSLQDSDRLRIWKD